MKLAWLVLAGCWSSATPAPPATTKLELVVLSTNHECPRQLVVMVDQIRRAVLDACAKQPTRMELGHGRHLLQVFDLQTKQSATVTLELPRKRQLAEQLRVGDVVLEVVGH